MIRAEINWRLALYSGALVGGVLWAVLAGRILGAENATDATQFTVSTANWWIIIATSGALFVAGVLAAGRSRGIVARSLGVALLISALSGWFMIAWLAVQGL